MPVLTPQERTRCEGKCSRFLSLNFVVYKASPCEKDNSDFIVLQLKYSCHLSLYYYFITHPRKYMQAHIHGGKRCTGDLFSCLAVVTVYHIQYNFCICNSESIIHSSSFK